MKPKKLKKLVSNDSFTANEVGVLVENLQSQFRIFGEDLSTIKEKVDIIFEEQGKQKEDIFIIKADVRIIKCDITILKSYVAEIKENLKDDSKRITRLETIK